ncbi:phosphate acetyltransferase [Helicobacter cetorum]|uniref:Phosphate acetyltransferase n=1 Tax=Helicobacter cetorum (strain ATCC BAA-540 / CCUG 52418 / MIT 99-5656) TaxID=1163745 RepID=I0ETQ6_HELCM|nr:phosphate acetyltransferase [Helicobacter cetorum]AFI06325.1 phosphotransacetylase [Helicobacter cetorum MIT 99-5656]
MRSLWIYPESIETLEIACKTLLKALEPRYQKIALFSPINGKCEKLSLNIYSAIDKEKALELVSDSKEELLFESILKRYHELQATHDFVVCLGYVPKFFLNAILDLNTTLAKHLNAPIVAIAESNTQRLKAMHSSVVKKEAPFALGLLVGEMPKKPSFLSASICKERCELEAGVIQDLLQVKSMITTPLAFQNALVLRAKEQVKKVVLPESEDERVLKATHHLNQLKAVKLVLLGNEESIFKQAKALNLNLEGVEIIDPSTSNYKDEFAKCLYELRKSKGLSVEEAQKLVLDKTYFATMLVHLGYADAMVSGAIHTTADTIRPALQIIKTKPNVSLVSSVFLMCLDTQVLVFGDCAINPNPSPKELAEIAMTSAQTAKQFGITPKVAMLSYSTGSSGKGEMVDKIKEATQLAKDSDTSLEIDGPLQFDASIDLSVAQQKMPHSKVAGQANVFIFPDLNAGNIGYKAVQRSAKAIAIGPVLQGLNKPINDLSRGCLVEDIINTVLISAIQAQA